MGQDSFTPEMLTGKIKEVAAYFKDYRQGKNISYSVTDVFLSAFSVFFMQCASFLEYQEAMERKYAMNNARNLFGIKKIPTPEQVRNVLDTYQPRCLFPIFTWCFDRLVVTGGMDAFKSELGYLIALDGTQYHSSTQIHCKNCLTKTDKKTKEVTYYHSAITPVIVKPGGEQVLSLVPEFISPQDGAEKQDCENAAVKRWIKTYGRRLAGIEKKVTVTILGDDLYSRQPVIQAILGQSLSFILVCKRESHPWLYDWVDHLEEGYSPENIHILTTRKWNGTTHEVTTYRFTNNIPLKDSQNTLLVNWCEVTIKSEETGKLLYHNAFITNHQITSVNVPLLVGCGRARWKIENENNNTLKTKGYHFEHNYGHGKQFLSMVLLTLILLAFSFHTLLDLTHYGYQQIRSLIGSRVRFFNDLKTLTKYSCYRNFNHLFTWMYQGLTKGQHQPDFALPPPLVFTGS